MRFRHTALIVIALASSVASNAVVPVHRSMSHPPSATKAAQLAAVPTQYAASLTNLKTCDDLTTQYSDIPDIVGLLNSFVKQNKSALGGPEKNEFETTASYNDRITRSFIGTVGSDQIVVQVPLDESKIHYDADGGTLTFSSLFEGYGRYRTLPFFSETLDLGSSLGTNGYGATARIQTYELREYRLAFLSEQYPDDKKTYMQPVVRIRSDPDTARSIKSQAHILLMAKLTPPFLQSSVSGSDATIQHPTQMYHDTTDLIVNLQCAFIMAAGKIVDRIDVSNAP